MRHRPAAPRPATVEYVLWFGFAAVASTLLLAVTNELCLDVAVIPFLWVLPLALYLLSFVLCFEYERVGRPASTKIDLYKRALEDGILPVPGRS